MASSAADGYGGGEEQYMYHVPQHSRREKLRYSHDDPSTFHLLQQHDHPNPAPPFHHTTAASFFPSSSSSYQNPNNYAFCSTAPSPHQIFPHHHSQISTNHRHHEQLQQPFSLSLSSSSPRRQQHQMVEVNPNPTPNPIPNPTPTPLGPFTGYAEILNRSRFTEPARRLMEEICSVGGQWPDPSDRAAEGMTAGRMDFQLIVGGEQQQQQWKKTKLISMLDEVYRRYKLYYQQVQAVIASFESVPGLSSAAPYASVAVKVMSKHFRCLKNAISDQLHHINKAIGKEGFREEENSGFGLINRSANDYGTVRQPHVWRPQRGLPERAVAVLRAWLFEHFLHPYPSDTDKQMLAKQTGLTRNQVSNWFINARVRLWKPMVEEIHSLEMRQQNKAVAGDTNHRPDKQAQLPSSSTATSLNDLDPFQNASNNNQNQSSKRPHHNNQNQSSKWPHDELMQMPNHTQAPNYIPFYDGFSGHHNIGVGGGVDVKGSGGVSLALGLQQNSGVCLTDQIPLNVVRRLGIGYEECTDPYVIGSFGGQNRQFGKDIGGHLLHDFVG